MLLWPLRASIIIKIRSIKPFLYAHKKNVGVYCCRPLVRPLVRRSVHNCLYRLHFLMDFFYFWGIGQYHKYDFSHQIWWRSDNFSRIQSILIILKFSSLIVQNAISKSKMAQSSQNSIGIIFSIEVMYNKCMNKFC